MSTASNKALCDTLRTKLALTLKPLELELGIKLNVGNMRYSENDIDIKLEALTPNRDGEILTKEAEALLSKSLLLPWLNDIVKSTFEIDGSEYKLTGYNYRARKNPFQAIAVSGPSKGRTVVFGELFLRKQHNLPVS